MSPNTLTIVVGAVGVFASFVVSILFYRRGARSSSTERAELRNELSENRQVLSNVVAQLERLLGPSSVAGIRKPARENAAPAVFPYHAPESAPTSAVDVLVRASLGALVNEHGEVALQRLMSEVGPAIGAARFGEVFDVLRELRAEGVVEWEGGAAEPSQTETLRLRPAGSLGESGSTGARPRTKEDSSE